MTRPTPLLLALLALPALALPLLADDPAPADASPPFAWGEPKKLCDLADPEIQESSGVAASRTLDGVLWTHNDSGDAPRVFAVDREGRTRATFRLEGAEAFDWEDMCAFSRGGKGWLLVGDTGDNDAIRAEVVLYLVEEPKSLPPEGASSASLPVRARIAVTYEDGPRDCESVAVDETTGQVLLVSKHRRRQKPVVYALDLPPEDHEGPARAVARRVAEIDVPPLVTALDVSCDGRLAVALTYVDAYVFARAEGESWAEAFGRAPLRVSMPRRAQGESICFGRDGRTLYLTSEKLPTPLWEVPPR